MSDEPAQFGRYRVVRRLGSGTMGEVYVAHDELFGRDVAVKSLRIAVGPAGALFRKRFVNEAKAIAALSHPHIVQVFDLGVERDAPFLVMELVPGTSLAEVTKETRLAPGEIREMGVQMARALAAAHASKILHRDVKPENILRAGPGAWKLADFGVARIPDSSLTITGQFLGTPAYAAPEALLAGEFSPASDVYSLGVTLYEAAAGQRPHQSGEGRWGPAKTAIQQAPPSLSALRPDLPLSLAAAIMKALAVDPAARPGAAALAETLGEASASPSTGAARAPTPRAAPRKRRLVWIVGSLALAGVVAAVVGVRALRQEAPSPVALSAAQRLERTGELVHRGKLQEATVELEAILRQDPDNEVAAEWLGRLRAALGKDVPP